MRGNVIFRHVTMYILTQTQSQIYNARSVGSVAYRTHLTKTFESQYGKEGLVTIRANYSE